MFCAASLTPTVEQALEQLELDASVQGAGSRTLLNQLKAGARADIVLLADPRLQQQLPPESVSRSANIAGNSLVLVRRLGPTPKPAATLESPSLTLAVADPGTAPLGHYSAQALTNRSLKCKTVRLKNAGAVLAAVLLEHVDIGLIYASDLKNNPQLEVLEKLSASTHDPIRYRAVRLNSVNAGADRLFDFLTSSKGKALLQEQGFEELEPEPPISRR